MGGLYEPNQSEIVDYDDYRPNLYLVYINDAYVDYLRSKGDKNVLWHEHESYINRRIYIGGITIGGLKYYLPFQHGSGRNEIYLNTIKDGNQKLNNILYIPNRNNKVIARITVDHMIPVPDEFVEPFNLFNAEVDEQRAKRLHYEAVWCKQNKDRIIDSARFIYQKFKESQVFNHKEITHSRGLNFSQLEHCYFHWDNVDDLYKFVKAHQHFRQTRINDFDRE